MTAVIVIVTVIVSGPRLALILEIVGKLMFSICVVINDQRVQLCS